MVMMENGSKREPRALPPGQECLRLPVPTSGTKREIVQIGRNYSVPDERLYPKLVDLARQVYDKFSTNETDALIVAQLLGHASIGGAFNGKVATLSSYGLVERRQGKIRLTDIGRRAVVP